MERRKCACPNTDCLVQTANSERSDGAQRWRIGQQNAFPSSQRRGGCAIKRMPRSHRSGADGVVRPAQRLAELTINRGFALTGSRFAPGAPASIKLSRHPLLCEEGNALHPYVTVITKSSTNLGAAFCSAATRGIEFRPLCMRRHVSDLSAAGAEPR